MTGSGMTVTGSGIIIASRHGGTRTGIGIIAGEAAVAVTVEVAAEVGAKIASEIVRENGRETENATERESEIAAGAAPTAELAPGAEVEASTVCIGPG